MRKAFLIGGTILLLAALGAAVWYFAYFRSQKNLTGEDLALKAGRDLSNGRCEGTGPGTLTNLPMNLADFSMIIPYGSVVDDHVTPIDHQYYSPTIFNSPRDTYPVYAMADARIVDIQSRDTERGQEYRLVLTMSCTFLYYYDLVTSLAPDIMVAYENKGFFGLDIEVKAGQEIGRIGGQTLDFAVWDTTKPLAGFVNPQSYVAEPWKIYTADPLEYSTPTLKEQMLSKYIRVVEPRSGKIDHDVDGRLVGNWFLEGTNGYAGKTGTQGSAYATGHFSIVPDHIDPSAFVASFGNYQGNSEQFSLSRSAPNPQEVTVETGLVKYSLLSWQYLDGKGDTWDRSSFPKAFPLTIINQGFESRGCVLLQLVEERKLKLEIFPRKNCSTIAAFTPAALFYTR